MFGVTNWVNLVSEQENPFGIVKILHSSIWVVVNSWKRFETKGYLRRERCIIGGLGEFERSEGNVRE